VWINVQAENGGILTGYLGSPALSCMFEIVPEFVEFEIIMSKEIAS